MPGAAPGVDVAGAGLADVVGGAVMRFGSVCSGIEAASVAFEPLGWSAAWLAEIEPFPSAVLAHHYPDVPNLGDMTAIPRRVLAGEIEAPDMLCGGTPCQAFSVAGLRESLSDERGNLTLTFVEIADAIDHVRGRRGDEPAIILWENVPGVLSTRDNAFGCFLAGLAGEDEPLEPPGGKWANAGAVYGPARAVAWRTLDAQYFGVAQRRRRVFVVASARDGFDPATVLFEWDGVRRDSAPSRSAGKGSSAQSAISVALRGREGGGTSELEALYNKGFNTLKEGNASTQETHPGTLLRTLRQEVGEEAFAKWGLGILDSLQQAEVLRQALHGLSIRPAAFSRSWVVHCALSRSENGSGWLLQSLREAGCERCASQGWEPSEQLAGKLGAYLSELSQPGAQASRFVRDLWWAAQGPGLLREALSAVQEVGRPAGRQGQSVLRGSEGRGSEESEVVPSAGMQCEVSRERLLHEACTAGEARDSRKGTTEQERSGKGWVGETPFAVRRLTVEECEFLQGFPRGYTAIPWRGKPADQCPDGPRYRALGNSWAVPCVRWIGRRIQRQIDRKVA